MTPPPDIDRYHRQMLLPGIGESGQQQLRNSHALVVGCGALGSVIIDSLARAGVGTLTIVDRDVVEMTNLQRQILYDENDVRQGTPKALAARSKIAGVNSSIVVHAHVDDFNHRNALRFIEGADIILDGLDNFETRYLLNDISISRGIPYIYGGAVGTTGVSMAILPAAFAGAASSPTPCLRCVFPEAPPPGASPTCDTAGVLGPLILTIAAHQATQAIKILTGNIAAVDRTLLSVDCWSNETRRFEIDGLRGSVDCPCCSRGEFAYLNGRSGSAATSLCGRNAVQVVPSDGDAQINLALLASKLAAHGRFQVNEFLLRGELSDGTGRQDQPIELTLFANGRAIIKGVTDPDIAKSIYSRYIGL